MKTKAKTEKSGWCSSAALALSLLGSAALALGCGSTDGYAMGKAWSGTGGGTGAIGGGTGSGSGGGESAGSWQQGYSLGQRNGSILVNRLKQVTIGQSGCAAVGDLENALIEVAKNIQAPVSNDEALVQGFFKGYLDSIRDAVKETRQSCDLGGYESGAFAGQLYGNLVCSMISVDISIVSGLDLEPLYTGWSGGSDQVIAGCETELSLKVQQCSDIQTVDTISLTIQQSCNDTLTL